VEHVYTVAIVAVVAIVAIAINRTNIGAKVKKDEVSFEIKPVQDESAAKTE